MLGIAGIFYFTQLASYHNEAIQGCSQYFYSLPDIEKLTYNDMTFAGYLFLEISDNIHCSQLYGEIFICE